MFFLIVKIILWVYTITECKSSRQSLFFSPELAHAQRSNNMTCILGEVCGDGLCCCSLLNATCANQNLSSVPRLPSAILHLDFSGNILSHLDEKTFQNLSLKILNLDNNHISNISNKAFKGMPNLTTLILSRNNLTDFEELVTALNTSNIEYLVLDDNRIKDLHLGHVTCLNGLRRLSLFHNKIRVVQVGSLERQITLDELNIGDNLLEEFPVFCSPNVSARYFIDLRSLNIQWNKITSLNPHAMNCLANLTHLNMDGNAIHHIKENIFQGFPRLENLSLRFCMSRIIDRHAFNHTFLTHLDVSENLWFFDKVYGPGIDTGLFLSMPRLMFINVSWTVFRYSDIGERNAVLSSISHVRAIAVDGTGLEFIPEMILENFTHLERLSFARNEISFLPDNTFEHLTNLSSLDLSFNRLTTFSKGLLGHVISRSNVTIDVSGNPFSCTCDLLWFIELYKEDATKTTGRIFTGSIEYTCTNPLSERNKNLATVDVTEHTCLLMYETYVTILFVTSFCLVFFLVVSLVFRFRWQIRFALYTIQHRLSNHGSPSQAAQRKFNAFVSYDSSDSSWVHETLQTEMEQRRGFRLCLHERDFLPGKYITHNIIERMEESGAILLVLSNAFLHSDWCRFELFLSLKYGMAKRRIPVVPVLLESIDRNVVDTFISTLLDTTTYLPWPQSRVQEEEQQFWKNLTTVLTCRGESIGVRTS